MFKILSLYCLSVVISLVKCQSSLNLLQIQIDDFLNSKLTLFPNQTIQYHQNLEEETLENFKFILQDDSVLNTAYENFKLKYGERQAPLELLDLHTPTTRKELFRENLVYIFHHNLLARMKLFSTFEMGVNKFADMHMDEFKSERLGLTISEETSPIDHFLQNFTDPEVLRNIPAKYDWREHGCISPVKDQMKCGACVMFALTSAMEGHHAIRNDRRIVDLSEQYMVDCAIRANGYSKNRGCDGNTYPDTLKFSKDYGVTAEYRYPYTGKQGKCQLEGMFAETQLKDYKKLPDKTSEVKLAVARDGPVPIGIYVWKQFMFYESGIYDFCGSPSTAAGGHAMAITGYNEADKAYIIKNQWGTDWGDNGYVRYTYADARCGMEKMAYALVI